LKLFADGKVVQLSISVKEKNQNN